MHLYDVLKGEVRFHQNVNWKSDNDDSDDEVAVDDNVDDDDKDNDNNDCDTYNVNDDNFLKAEVYFPSHGMRICIKRKKIHYGKFFDFCAEKCVYN